MAWVVHKEPWGEITEEGVLARISRFIFDQETTWRAKQVKNEHGYDKEVATRLSEITGFLTVNPGYRGQDYRHVDHAK
jgi:hypothetical protein